MSRYHGGWAPYVSVEKRRRNAAREMEKLRKKGVAVSPVTIEGRKIAATFWGMAWCDNLESYHDYENRLPRGRTYVRNGSVVDLQIAPREVTAIVSGSSLYKVKITIGEVAKTLWKSICSDCSGGIDSLVELLQGRFSKGVMERICRQGAGLFPKPGEIRFSCSCPDGASMCKHVAAVMYGVGARLDTKPELLFRLRAVNENDLVANIGQGLPLSGHAVDSGKVLETDDMAALFGLEMGDAAEVASPQPVVAKTPASRRKAATAEAGKAAPVKKPALREKSVPVAVVGAADEAMRTGKVVSGKTRVAAKKPETPSPVAIVQASAKPVEWWKPGAVKQAARAAKAGQERPAAARKVRVAS